MSSHVWILLMVYSEGGRHHFHTIFNKKSWYNQRNKNSKTLHIGYFRRAIYQNVSFQEYIW